MTPLSPRSGDGARKHPAQGREQRAANRAPPARIPPPRPRWSRRWPGRACPAAAAVPRCLAGDLRPRGPALLEGRIPPRPGRACAAPAGQVRDPADGLVAAAECGCSSTPQGPERAGPASPRLSSAPEAPGRATEAVPERCVSGEWATGGEAAARSGRGAPGRGGAGGGAWFPPSAPFCGC